MRIRIDPLDILFSKYIRLRALKRVGGCERCLSPKKISELQCSHFHGRRKKSVRWHEDNAVGLCFSCHRYFTENPLEHTEFFKEKLGIRFEPLRITANIPQKVDKDLIQIYLEQKMGELDAQKKVTTKRQPGI